MRIILRVDHFVKTWLGSSCLLTLALMFVGPEKNIRADEVDNDLQTISRIGPNAEGVEAARAARERLASQRLEILPRLLLAMDTRNSVAANWYRTVYEELVSREFSRKDAKFPIPFLKEYVKDSTRQGRPRRLVLDLVGRLEPDFKAVFIPQRIDDPEFRADAISAVLANAEKLQKQGDAASAKALFQTAFTHARDPEQITAAAAKLSSLGVKASIVEQMGFVVDWYLAGPFDAPGYSGFSTEFPPEQQVDLQAVYSGQTGKSIKWVRFQSADSMGQLNLLKAIASTQEAVGYAYSELNSPREQAVQLRCGADDNCTVWLNGRKIFGREQWLNGIRLDRFVAPAQLKQGRNTLLVKICQGPRHKDPEVPNNWTLQLRFCDAEGAAVGLKSALPPISTAETGP